MKKKNNTHIEYGIFAFTRVLKHAGRWLLSRELKKYWKARDLRLFAEHSEGKIISGQNGYIHRMFAKSDEINHCANRLKAQARKMNKRAKEILGR